MLHRMMGQGGTNMSTRKLPIGRLALSGALAAFALGGLNAPAAAQDEWTAQVRRLLQQAGKTFEERGYSMTHSIYTGSLNASARENVTVNLDIGTEYQVMGVCDTDCTDVDLVVRDSGGNEVGSDVLDDDVPIVAVTPRRSGTYQVTVIMANCSAEPCRYGIGVFGK
jgi:hypothetical protein